VLEIRFSREGGAAAFRTRSGLALAAVADPEGPETRMRIAADTGRRTISPRRDPPRPVVVAVGVSGPVAPFGETSFLTGLAGGGLGSVAANGEMTPLAAPFEGPLEAIARDPASAAVAACGGRRIVVLADDRHAPAMVLLAPGPVAALDFSPDGRLLAAAHAEGVSLWRGGAAEGLVAVERPARLSFSPDGRMLACPLAGRGVALVELAGRTVTTLADFPGPTASVAWTVLPPAFIASGAFRVAAWERAAHGLGRPIEAGRVGRLVVAERVAACPERPLVAAGYANGTVLITRLGGRDEVLLRAAGPAVTALAWSPDGRHLGVGDAAGGAALAALPADLFK
jgi:hypothetical protein